MSPKDIIITGCDGNYFEKFGGNFLSSIQKYIKNDVIIFIIFSGSVNTFNKLNLENKNDNIYFLHDIDLIKLPSKTNNFTYLQHLPLSLLNMLVIEKYRSNKIIRKIFKILLKFINPTLLIDRNHLHQTRLRPYYTTLRFLIPEYYLNNSKNILICDIDSHFNFNPFEFSSNFRSETIYAVMREFNTECWSKFLTGILLFKGANATRNYLLFQEKIINRILNSEIFWGMDQYEFDIFSNYHHVCPLPNDFYSFHSNSSAVIETYKGDLKWSKMK